MTRLAPLLLSLILLAAPAQAGGFFERVGELIDSAGRTVEGAARVLRGEPDDPDASPEDESSEGAFQPELPEDLPDDWRAGFVREPVFGARMLVLEAGMEHERSVLLVHGLGQNAWRDWEAVIPALAEHYHVLVFDLPGFGHSEKPGGRYSPTNYARVIHWLVEQNGRDTVDLVGHSMGGAVALRYAASYPETVNRLVLADVAGILERTAFVKHVADLGLDAGGAPGPIQRAAARVQHWGDTLVEVASGALPDVTGVLRTSNLAWNAILQDRPNTNAALALIQEDFSGAIASLDVPTHIIWGEQDPVAPLRIGRLLAGRLAQSSLYVIPAAEHVPMKSHTKAFNERLLAFLGGEDFASHLLHAPEDSKGDLRCDGEVGKTYSGRFDTITLTDCTAVVLDGVWARKLVVENSQVELRDVFVHGEDTALEVGGSAIVATNAEFAGRVGIRSRDSRLDLAGVTVRGEQSAVRATARSRFLFSVSDLHDDHHSGPVHGAYRLSDGELSEDQELGR